jgi:hypothetical protein
MYGIINRSNVGDNYCHCSGISVSTEVAISVLQVKAVAGFFLIYETMVLSHSPGCVFKTKLSAYD